jgi:hypothetical protein
MGINTGICTSSRLIVQVSRPTIKLNSQPTNKLDLQKNPDIPKDRSTVTVNHISQLAWLEGFVYARKQSARRTRQLDTRFAIVKFS